jgi:hypothetical protein
VIRRRQQPEALATGKTKFKNDQRSFSKKKIFLLRGKENLKIKKNRILCFAEGDSLRHLPQAKQNLNLFENKFG